MPVPELQRPDHRQCTTGMASADDTSNLRRNAAGLSGAVLLCRSAGRLAGRIGQGRGIAGLLDHRDQVGSGQLGRETTRAVPVAKLTVALTPSSLLSFFSTLAAHEAQVIPPIVSSRRAPHRPARQPGSRPRSRSSAHRPFLTLSRAPRPVREKIFGPNGPGVTPARGLTRRRGMAAWRPAQLPASWWSPASSRASATVCRATTPVGRRCHEATSIPAPPHDSFPYPGTVSIRPDASMARTFVSTASRVSSAQAAPANGGTSQRRCSMSPCSSSRRQSGAAGGPGWHAGARPGAAGPG